MARTRTYTLNKYKIMYYSKRMSAVRDVYIEAKSQIEAINKFKSRHHVTKFTKYFKILQIRKVSSERMREGE